MRKLIGILLVTIALGSANTVGATSIDSVKVKEDSLEVEKKVVAIKEEIKEEIKEKEVDEVIIKPEKARIYYASGDINCP